VASLHKKEAPVIIDYSSPNIAKPLGVHHILSTMIGQVIGNFYVHAGIPVVRWNYLGDSGGVDGEAHGGEYRVGDRVRDRENGK
jgi:arginyl-tRNA synthetase